MIRLSRLSSLFFLFAILFGCSQPKKYIRYEGTIFGTSFHVIYESHDTLSANIDSTLQVMKYCFSTYEKGSEISRVNQNDSTVVLSQHFLNVYNCAYNVSKATNGAFDMTVAPLVNVWGFGFTQRENVTQWMVDSILQFVGYDKVALVNNRIVKSDPRVMLDASAISKGYGVDMVGVTLEKMGVKNYMVEIGGEIRTKGTNDKGIAWVLAIDKPIENESSGTEEFHEFIGISNRSVATSGNYRNFYYKDGVKYAHTINPKTGYPALNEVLSVTVIAPDCMTADAYATSFMVMGLDSSIEVLKGNRDLEAYFICADSLGNLEVTFTLGFEKWIKK